MCEGIEPMTVSKKKMLAELQAIKKPKLVYESEPVPSDLVRVIAGEGGYTLEVTEYPIDGPFEIPEDEFEEAVSIFEFGEDSEGYADASEEQLEMIEAGCEPGIAYYRYQSMAGDGGQAAVFNDELEELEEMLIEDVMDSIDCEPWAQMSAAELQEWYTWYKELEE